MVKIIENERKLKRKAGKVYELNFISFKRFNLSFNLKHIV